MTKLTAKETALMTQIAKGQFSYFDEGLVAGSGIWSDALTHEAGAAVSSSARGAATVMSSLCRKGLLHSDQGAYLSESTEDGAWVELTEAGQAWIEEFNGETQAEATERILAERAAAKEELVFDTTQAEVIYEEIDGVVTIDKDPVAEGTIPGSIIREFVDGADEWIVETFADNSQVTRRRRQVSGAWRTDFWGYTAEGKKVPTTSKAAKAAREAGKFSI